MRKGYVDSTWGQLHYREQGASEASPAEPPLVCLHATAYSGRTFAPIVAPLSRSRRVIAPDTPGYGESDGPAQRPDFETYARVLFDATMSICGPGPVDLFGHHTGALLAIEMALIDPARIRRIVLVGVPFFEGDEKGAWHSKLVHRTTLDESFDQFRARWDYFVTNRTPGLSLDRAFECFVDELKVYPREWWAHEALFDYPAETRLPLVANEVLVINPTSALAAASTRAAGLMRRARIVDVPELGGAIFDLGTARLASMIDAFLCHGHA